MQSFTLASDAFADGEAIPVEYTCDGENAVPPLRWSGAPASTRSYALVMDDPDAPGGTFTHWLLYDVPPTIGSIQPETPASQLGKTLKNGFGRQGYGGPCPPRGHGAHRYRFTLHAMDTPSLHLRGSGRAALDTAIHQHSIAVATLTGRYERR